MKNDTITTTMIEIVAKNMNNHSYMTICREDETERPRYKLYNFKTRRFEYFCLDSSDEVCKKIDKFEGNDISDFITPTIDFLATGFFADHKNDIVKVDRSYCIIPSKSNVSSIIIFM